MTENLRNQRIPALHSTRYCVRFLSHECVIHTSHDLLTEWRPFLSPFFDITKKMTGSPPIFCVEESPETVEQLLHHVNVGSAELITLHCDIPGSVVVKEPGHITIAAPELKTVYTIEYRDTGVHITYVCKHFSESASLDLLRLVRGILIGRAQTKGMKRAHMSVVSLKGSGIGFIGGKNSGKTSFMLAFLKQFPQSSFVSNDKVLLSLENAPLVFGLPYAVSIGFGALECCREIPFTEERRVIDEKAYYWPEELAEYLDRTISPSVELSSLIHVQIDPGATNLKCTEITDYHEKKEVILENVIRFSDKTTPHWLLDLLDIHPDCGEFVNELTRCRLLIVRGNPWNGNVKQLMEESNLFQK